MQGQETRDEWKQVILTMIQERKTFSEAYFAMFKVNPNNAAYQRINQWRIRYGLPAISQIQGEVKYLSEIIVIGTKEVAEIRKQRYQKDNDTMKRWNTFPDIKPKEDEDDALLLL